jgi:hypothetical protein
MVSLLYDNIARGLHYKVLKNFKCKNVVMFIYKIGLLKYSFYMPFF